MDFGRLGRAIGRSAGRGGKRVLRRDEDDAAAEALILHDPVAGPGGQEIAGGEDRDVAVPKFERGVLERRRRGDARVGDDDVDPAVAEDGVAERGLRRRLVRHVADHACDRVLAEKLAEFGDGPIEARSVDVREHDAGAVAP